MKKVIFFTILAVLFTAPGIVYAQTDTTVYATADVYLDDANPTTNYGSSNALFVGPHGNDGLNDDFASVVRFNLPPLVPGSVISIAIFDMQLFVDQSQVSTIYAYRITSPSNWNENTISWNSNVSGDMKTSAGYLVTSGSSQLYRFDVQSILNSWYNGNQNNGFFIAATFDQGSANSYHTFWSRESGKSPSLRVIYTSNPVTLSYPSNGVANQTTSVTLGWNGLIYSTNYRLQVSTDSIFSTTVWDDSLPGTSQTISDLANGTTYYWRVYASNSFGVSGWSSTWSFTTIVIPAPTIVSFFSDLRCRWHSR